MPVELDDGLDMIKHNALDDKLDGSFTAHPHFDPATGEYHAICYDTTQVHPACSAVLLYVNHLRPLHVYRTSFIRRGRASMPGKFSWVALNANVLLVEPVDDAWIPSAFGGR